MSFDRISYFYNFVEKYILRDYEISIELFNKYFNLKTGSSVIDIGGGTGLFSETIIDRIEKMVIVEPSLKMIRRNINPKLSAIQGDGSDLSIKNESFDLAIIINVIHHIPDKYHKDVISETYRVLKKKGNIFIMEIFPLSLVNRFFAFLERLTVGTVYYVNDDKLKSILKDAGFKKIKVDWPENYSCRYVMIGTK